jgi:hypothetical protein
MSDPTRTDRHNNNNNDIFRDDFPFSSPHPPPPPPPMMNHGDDENTDSRYSVNHDDSTTTNSMTKRNEGNHPMDQLPPSVSYYTEEERVASTANDTPGSLLGTATTTTTGKKNKNYHKENENDEDPMEKVVSTAVQMLHSALDRIIQQEIIDPMVPILNQNHSLQQHIIATSNSPNTIPTSDPKQDHAFLVRYFVCLLHRMVVPLTNCIKHTHA